MPHINHCHWLTSYLILLTTDLPKIAEPLHQHKQPAEGPRSTFQPWQDLPRTIHIIVHFAAIRVRAAPGKFPGAFHQRKQIDPQNDPGTNQLILELPFNAFLAKFVADTVHYLAFHTTLI
jgi:hypothetical protein